MEKCLGTSLPPHVVLISSMKPISSSITLRTATLSPKLRSYKKRRCQFVKIANLKEVNHSLLLMGSGCQLASSYDWKNLNQESLEVFIKNIFFGHLLNV